MLIDFDIFILASTVVSESSYFMGFFSSLVQILPILFFFFILYLNFLQFSRS